MQSFLIVRCYTCAHRADISILLNTCTANTDTLSLFHKPNICYNYYIKARGGVMRRFDEKELIRETKKRLYRLPQLLSG